MKNALSVNDPVDPRIQRSRSMLVSAFSDLLQRKEFDSISVGEVAEEAGLNRATFYLHYPDKQALLASMTEERFRALIKQRGIVFTGCPSALHAIALGVCDYLTEITSCPVKGAQLPLESSLIPVLEGLFVEGLSQRSTPLNVEPALLATTAAWALFGAARRWFQSPDRIPAPEMAAQIGRMLGPILLS